MGKNSLACVIMFVGEKCGQSVKIFYDTYSYIKDPPLSSNIYILHLTIALDANQSTRIIEYVHMYIIIQLFYFFSFEQNIFKCILYYDPILSIST